jgi:hypothetical protein
MSDINFDINELQKRIQEVKQEEEESTTFTLNFLECLIKRHDLNNMIDDQQQFEDVPNSIVQYLSDGKIPPKEEIELLSPETQDYLVKDCVFICGMGAISYYSDNNPIYKDMEPRPFDAIIEMPNISPGHHTSAYIVAALALLFADIPAQDMLELITNKFSSEHEQLEKNVETFNELCVSILKRYNEDKLYYST